MADVRKFTVQVMQTVEVELDADKFDTEFMEEFRTSFFRFDALEEHAEHIAQLQARGVVDASYGKEFIEGYGYISEMGIAAKVIDTEIEVQP